jgi:hypothetical protein
MTRATCLPQHCLREAITICCLALIFLCAYRLNGQTVEASNQQSVERADLLRTLPSVSAAPGISPTGTEGGYAATTPNNADLGEQRILKRVEEYKPFSVQLAVPIYYTSNVALVRRGERGDVIVAPGIALTYAPRITKTFFGELSVQEQVFEYGEFHELNFQSFDAIAGVVWYLPQFYNLTLRARYDFNRLTNEHWDEFYRNHSFIVGAELPYQFSRAQQFSIGTRANLSFSATPDEPQRNDYELYVGYLAALSRSFAVSAVGRVVVRDYQIVDRADASEIIALSAYYRLTDWWVVSALGSYAWNRSDHSVFDYEVGNVGGALAFTLRF